MDAQTIGNNAGKVWRLLDHNRKWEYNELKEATGLSDRDLNAAIGWLAREDKIQFEKKGAAAGRSFFRGCRLSAQMISMPCLRHSSSPRSFSLNF